MKKKTIYTYMCVYIYICVYIYTYTYININKYTLMIFQFFTTHDRCKLIRDTIGRTRVQVNFLWLTSIERLFILTYILSHLYRVYVRLYIKKEFYIYVYKYYNYKANANYSASRLSKKKICSAINPSCVPSDK